MINYTFQDLHEITQCYLPQSPRMKNFYHTALQQSLPKAFRKPAAIPDFLEPLELKHTKNFLWMLWNEGTLAP